jgi:pyruvate kinase
MNVPPPTPGVAAPARTKIIATVGPACRDPEKLTALAQAGVDVFRLNMAHGTREQHAEVVRWLRQIESSLARPLGILADLAGPKIRLGELPGGRYECRTGGELRFVRGDVVQGADELVTTYEPLVDELRESDSVMLADGTISLIVEERASRYVRCRVVQGGTVRSRQGVNLPGVKLSVPAMDDEDWQNAEWSAAQRIDFVGLSFVRTPVEVERLKKFLLTRGSQALVVAKVEKQEALDQLEAIVQAADAVMVARGDLGVEIDVARTPLVQKQIVAMCHRYQRPAIIATQMLDSMQHSRRPTRAEVTDVANAILDGADACMLSGETAVGDHPLVAVEMMHRIALATEEEYRQRPPRQDALVPPDGLHPITQAVVHGAGRIAAELDARLIVVASRSGVTALAVSRQRSFVPTLGVSDNESTLRQMCLYWGVTPVAGAPVQDRKQLLAFVSDWGLRRGLLRTGDRIVLLVGSRFGTPGHNMAVVHEVA